MRDRLVFSPSPWWGRRLLSPSPLVGEAPAFSLPPWWGRVGVGGIINRRVASPPPPPSPSRGEGERRFRAMPSATGGTPPGGVSAEYSDGSGSRGDGRGPPARHGAGRQRVGGLWPAD